MKHLLATLLLGLCLPLAYAQKIAVDPTLIRAASAPGSEVSTVEGFRANAAAFTFDRISFNPDILSLIAFKREDGTLRETLGIIVYKNRKTFGIQYIYRNSANGDTVWLRIKKAQLTLNKPFAPGAELVGEVRFSFSGTVTNPAGQPEEVSGTVAGKFGGTVPVK